MDLKLKGKRALITASTGGIGRALAETLLEEGASVIIHGSREETTKEALKELKKKYRDVTAVAADLSDAAGCNKLIKEVTEQVDILINNFGIYEFMDFFEISDNDWTNFFEANVLSGVRLSRHFLKPMLKNNWGRILFVSSESGLNIPEDMIQYGMTKTAQLSLMRGLAKLTQGTAVTVNSLLPGPTLTEGVQEFLDKLADKKGVCSTELKKNFVKENRPTSLLQRFAETQEVASMAAFLCSPLSCLTNGSAVKVEGGIVDQIV